MVRIKGMAVNTSEVPKVAGWWCVYNGHRKISFPSRAKCRRAIKSHQGYQRLGLREFYCEGCNGWHITSQGNEQKNKP